MEYLTDAQRSSMRASLVHQRDVDCKIDHDYCHDHRRSLYSEDIRAGDPVSAESSERAEGTLFSLTRPNTVETAFKDRFVRLQAENPRRLEARFCWIEWKNFRLRITQGCVCT
jgi:hypothetical protein